MACSGAIEGWIILVIGIHEEVQEDDLHNVFGEFGEIKNLLTGFVKAQAAISRMDGDSIPTHIVNVDWDSSGSFLDGSKKKNTRFVLH
ncbi:hypothetical protein M0R45_026912 [Rubus argutus]|uniref:RRM domain-containing protein n=1 Tax=Rubus argutus TaxID=59490 RepID=A0AAW1X1F1_RUBAR